MPTIDLAVGKSKYRIDCAAGEEDKIQKLAALLNEKVHNLSANLAFADEKTILMLCGIMLYEELENIKNKNSNHRTSKNDNKNSNPSSNNENLYKSITENMNNIAGYIEKLVNKIKNY